ncbi:MAG: hypothetical protein IKH24_00400 [Bacteroidales bacterium]|jgi:hypothetical protein|nr:hypothetical protein [Bacteroidales bacterium]
MRRIIILLCSFLFASICQEGYAQTKYDELVDKVSSWISDTQPSGEGQKRVKTKTIEFPSFGYSVELDLSRGDLFPGSCFKVFNSDNVLTFDGVVSSIDNPVSLKGKQIGTNGVELLGSFRISNTPEGQFELKPRKAGELSITTSSVDFIIASDCGNPVIISALEKIVAVCGESRNSDFLCVSSSMSGIRPQNALDTDIRSILKSLSKNVTVSYKDKAFKGTVSPIAIEAKPISFVLKDGTCSFHDGKSVSIKESGDNYVMTITGDSSNNTGSESTYMVPKSSISEDKLWSEKDFIKQSLAYQKQQEQSLSSTKPVASSTNNPSSDNNSSKSSTSGLSTNKSESSGNGWLEYLIIAAIILIPILFIRRLIHARDCPHCGRKHAMVDVDKQFMGTAYEKREQQPDGKYVNVHYNKYKTIRQCKYCGYQDYDITEEKG